jgi:hypothetical protein
MAIPIPPAIVKASPILLCLRIRSTIKKIHNKRLFQSVQLVI